MYARTVGRSAIDVPACWNCVADACAAVVCTAASISPIETAADSTLNHGSTHAHHDREPAAVVAEAVGRGDAARPRRSPGSSRCRAGRARRTRPPRCAGPPWCAGPATASTARCPRAACSTTRSYPRGAPTVIQLLRAVSRTLSPSSIAGPTGAQNWLRDPTSENASVDRCVPAAIALRTSSGPWASIDRGGAVVHAHDHGRRAALAREPLDDDRRGGQAEALAADLGRADQPEQAGLAERLQRRRREHAAIDVGGVGGGDRRHGFDKLLVFERHETPGTDVPGEAHPSRFGPSTPDRWCIQ